jgi:hypothetical protein
MMELCDEFYPPLVTPVRGGVDYCLGAWSALPHSAVVLQDVDMTNICSLPAFDFSSASWMRPFAKRCRELSAAVWVKQEESCDASLKRQKHSAKFTLIKVLVKLLDGKVAVFSVDPSESVSRLKQRLLETRGVAPDHVQLFYRGTLLHDADSWAELRFESGALVRQLPTLEKYRLY